MAKKSFFASPSSFIESIDFDHRLAAYDLAASAAHAEMLGRCGVISRSDSAKLVRGLKALAARVEKGRPLPRAEDIHYAIEQALHKRLGAVAGKVHTARSRNDQVVTALRMYVRDHADRLIARLTDLFGAFTAQASANLGAVMPGFTHLQPGQPVLASHHLLAYAWMFLRDRDRVRDLRRRVNVLPLGSAALAGTTFPIDRKWVARKLGFDGVSENSIDAVGDRDFLVEFLSAGSLIMAHLSRFAEELVVWSHPAWGFVSLADEFVSGSSIMPQKRNPDTAELIRGKTGRVYGDLMALLTLIKAQPLAYNRDLQEDKPPFFDGVDVLESTLDVAVPLVRTLRLNPKRMRDACELGYILATDAADALVRRGMPFREAHGLVKDVVRYAQERSLPLRDVPLSVWRSRSALFGDWIKDVLSLDKAVAARASEGGTAPSSVKVQIRKLRRMLKSR